MRVTLKKVFTGVKTTKYGEKLSVGLKINEEKVLDIDGNEITIGDRYINGWFKEDFKFPHSEGDVVDILIKQRGEYLDFTLPGVGKPVADNSGIVTRIKALEDRITKLEGGTTTVVPEDDAPADPDNY